jgi:hypothetical protein
VADVQGRFGGCLAGEFPAPMGTSWEHSRVMTPPRPAWRPPRWRPGTARLRCGCSARSSPRRHARPTCAGSQGSTAASRWRLALVCLPSCGLITGSPCSVASRLTP